MTFLFAFVWRAPGRSSTRHLALILSFAVAVAVGVLSAQTPTPPEISTHDAAPGFTLKTERNVVTVRVVVRDSKGAAVDNLGKDDFKLFDHGKPQTITSFSLERPALKVSVLPQPAEEKAAKPETDEESRAPDSTARRFVGLFFDDVNTKQEDLVRTRDAADRYLSASVKPGDRVALSTSSGVKQIDFTSDVALIHQALFEIRQRPVTPGAACDSLPPYLGYLVVEQNNGENAAAQYIMGCLGCRPDDLKCLDTALALVPAWAQRTEGFTNTQVTAALRGVETLVRRMTTLPGQRNVVIISGGFLAVSPSCLQQLDDITDRALRAGVVLNAIDARGLYTPAIADASLGGALASQDAVTDLPEGIRRQTEALRNLAHDTGGIFFENSNDLDGGFRKVAGTPEAYYVLTFSPENLKHDGTFHDLKVSLVSTKGLSVQARRGYFAPRKSEDLASQEKEEIRKAVFSRDETHELSTDVHTKFFMKSELDAEITVLTHIDLHTVQFRKELDRNVDKLTFVAALFDQDGNYVDAQKKILEFKLKDPTRDKYLETGITMKSQFAVKPGSYQVRSVVCDSGSGHISGVNRTVEIPY